jgi:hypothetical protein
MIRIDTRPVIHLPREPALYQNCVDWWHTVSAVTGTKLTTTAETTRRVVAAQCQVEASQWQRVAPEFSLTVHVR